MFMKTYEAGTLLGLSVFQCQTRVVSDADTCNYTELCVFFFKLLNMLRVSIRVVFGVRIRAS
jgi:hypothetical protein